MTPDVTMIRYWRGIGFGLLFWQIPTVLRTRHTRKLRRIVLDMRRIEAALKGHVTSNPRELRVLRVPLRDRIMERVQLWWFEFKHVTAPRTPEEIAGRHPSWAGTP